MTTENLHSLAYRVLRYTPNLVRDEWFNIGILLLDPSARRLEARLIEDEADYARLRRLHPEADLSVVRALGGYFVAEIARHPDDPNRWLAELDQTLSNVLQLSPQRGVLAEDFDSELDRLYSDQVESPRYRAAAAAAVPLSRAGIRNRANEVFRRAGLWDRIERHTPVAEFTHKGDPMRCDYAYRSNGIRGFVHALALGGDPTQAKALAFTAERIRAKVEKTEFTALTEVEPRREEERHQFVFELLKAQEIELVAIARLEEWARRLRPRLQ